MAKSDENEDWPRTNLTEPDEALQTYVRRWKVHANVPLPYAGTVLELVAGVRNLLQRSKCSASFAAPLYSSGPSESGQPRLRHFGFGRGASQHVFLPLIWHPGRCT